MLIIHLWHLFIVTFLFHFSPKAVQNFYQDLKNSKLFRTWICFKVAEFIITKVLFLVRFENIGTKKQNLNNHELYTLTNSSLAPCILDSLKQKQAA